MRHRHRILHATYSAFTYLYFGFSRVSTVCVCVCVPLQIHTLCSYTRFAFGTRSRTSHLAPSHTAPHVRSAEDGTTHTQKINIHKKWGSRTQAHSIEFEHERTANTVRSIRANAQKGWKSTFTLDCVRNTRRSSAHRTLNLHAFDVCDTYIRSSSSLSSSSCYLRVESWNAHTKDRR